MERNLARAGNLELILPFVSGAKTHRILRACSPDDGRVIFDRAAYSFLFMVDGHFRRRRILTFGDIRQWIKKFSERFELRFPGYIEGAGYLTRIDIPRRNIYLESPNQERSLLLLAVESYLERYGFRVIENRGE